MNMKNENKKKINTFQFSSYARVMFHEINGTATKARKIYCNAINFKYAVDSVPLINQKRSKR